VISINRGVEGITMGYLRITKLSGVIICLKYQRMDQELEVSNQNFLEFKFGVCLIRFSDSLGFTEVKKVIKDRDGDI